MCANFIQHANKFHGWAWWPLPRLIICKYSKRNLNTFGLFISSIHKGCLICTCFLWLNRCLYNGQYSMLLHFICSYAHIFKLHSYALLIEYMITEDIIMCVSLYSSSSTNQVAFEHILNIKAFHGIVSYLVWLC